jgi:hypothetical protein
MFRRKLFATAISVTILLTATAVQAAPSTTVSLTTGWTSGVAGDMVVEVGSVTVTETPDGAVSLSFVVTRTIACPDLEGAWTTERWQATDAPATLSIKNNLASASAVATVIGGLSVTSDCPGVGQVTGNVGLVTIDALATDRTVRERTADGVRTLTRSVDVTVVAGSLIRQAPGEAQKIIG